MAISEVKGKGITIMHSRLLESGLNVRFGMSTRLGGVSPQPWGMNLSFRVGDDEENVLRNRNLFFGSLGIGQDHLAIPSQVHGNRVRTVTCAGEYENCDALITNVPDLFLCVSVADCVPIFLLDTKNRIVAAVHAGWRGTADGIVRSTLSLLGKEFGTNPLDLLAYVGPSAGDCCYIVGEEVAKFFSVEFFRRENGKTFLNLKAANASQLEEFGIPSSRIEVSPHCTISESHLFHSYRRDGQQSGRMMGVIGLLS